MNQNRYSSPLDAAGALTFCFVSDSFLADTNVWMCFPTIHPGCVLPFFFESLRYAWILNTPLLTFAPPQPPMSSSSSQQDTEFDFALNKISTFTLTLAVWARAPPCNQPLDNSSDSRRIHHNKPTLQSVQCLHLVRATKFVPSRRWCTGEWRKANPYYLLGRLRAGW